MANYRDKNDGKSALKMTVAMLLAGAIGAGICCAGFASRNEADEWFKNGDIKSWHWSDKSPSDDKDNKPSDDKPGENGGNTGDNTKEDYAGAVIGGEENKGIKLLRASIPREAYEANGVSEQAESAYTLTATITPDYATNKELDWTLSWLNADSPWASGKTVTNYVTLTPESDGAATAVCACVQDFGEPIVITVTSRDNPQAFATCFVNYYQRIKSVNYSFSYDGAAIEAPAADGNGVYKFEYTGAEKDYTVNIEPVYSAYTLTDEFRTTVSGKFSEAFGYSSSSNFNAITLRAGLTGGEPEVATANAFRSSLNSFIALAKNSSVNSESQAVGLGQYCQSIVSYRTTLKNINHPFYLHVKDLVDIFAHDYADYHGTQMPRVTNYPNLGDLEARMNSYSAPKYSYSGDIAIDSYNDFVTAVRNCNSAGVGVMQYTIKVTGTYSNYETTINLSFNDNFKITVQDITISDPTINF